MDNLQAGQAGRLAMADVRTMGLESKDRTFLTRDVIDALHMLHSRFNDNRPKTLCLHSTRNPVVVFTDGSYENSDAGEIAMVGGVLIDGDGPAKVFGCLRRFKMN